MPSRNSFVQFGGYADEQSMDEDGGTTHRDPEAEMERRMFENSHGQGFGGDETDQWAASGEAPTTISPDDQFGSPAARSRGGAKAPGKTFRESPTRSPPTRELPTRESPTDEETSQEPSTDAVSIDDAAGAGPATPKKMKKLGPGGIKVVLALFLCFLLVVSSIFTNGVLSWFGGAVRCRNPTSFGTVLQGTFLVIFYIITIHLIENRVI